MRYVVWAVVLAGLTVPYDRDTWGRWVDADGDCLNTRHEVLFEESLIPATVRECRVVAGRWRDVYTGHVHTDPRALDVDHVVALQDAHESGAAGWSAEQKRAYFNDLRHAEHLVAVARGVNRSKGGRGPDEWMPPGDPCWYVRAYPRIKARYRLTLTAAEARALGEVSC